MWLCNAMWIFLTAGSASINIHKINDQFVARLIDFAVYKIRQLQTLLNLQLSDARNYSGKQCS